MPTDKVEIGLRLVKFAAAVIRVLGDMPKNKVGKTISDQLLRCSTSVGANYEEEGAAESRGDFIHKMQVSLKEMRESYYWLLVIREASLLAREKIEPLCDEAVQLRAILSKSVATAKGKAKHVFQEPEDKVPINGP